MTKNKKATLGELELRELVDLGLRMPDGSKELFEVVDKRNDCITVMTKNIIDFIPFNDKNNKHSGNANSYTESSIRSYLTKLYQSVINENAELDKHNYGFKEFFLPSVSGIGLGGVKGWQAFKDDASRIKYPGTYASTKDESYGPGEADWYWTSTTYTTNASRVRTVGTDGTLRSNNAYYGGIGATPVLNLKAFAPVTIIDGVWSLYDCISDTSNDESVDIKIGDWVEVTHTAETDIQEGILLGDCFEVAGFGAQGEVEIILSSGKSWYLSTDQVRESKPPLLYHEKTRESVEHNERLKGYYQHTAIETLKVYHTAHKVKEERIKALNKALENIQELIKLEKEE